MTWTAIRVDKDTQEAIKAQGRFGESFNDVLRRILNVPPPAKGMPPAAKRGRPRMTKK